MESFHSNKKMTKPEVGMREWAITVTGLTMLLGGGPWKTWELWIKEDVEHSKHGLVSHPSWNLHHKSSESNVVYKDPLKGFQRGTVLVMLENGSISPLFSQGKYLPFPMS